MFDVKKYQKNYQKKYRKNNKTRIAKIKHIHYMKNKEKINEYGKKWYCDNRNTQKLKMKQWYLNNIENIKKYRQKNNKYIKEYRRKYSQANKTIRNQKIKIRLKNDINFKIRNALRARVAAAIKHNHKSTCTMELIGCSVKELKYYLSKQFKPGMSWKNHGKWHIDHKIPCCKFNLSIPEEQRNCFNYRNLQPLWAEDNLKKGGS
jgi:hypothetical protein